MTMSQLMLCAGSQPPQSICSLRNAEMTSPQVRRRSSLSNVECGGKAAVFCIIDIVRGRGYIDELCVLPAWRGNDLGTRLLSWRSPHSMQPGSMTSNSWLSRETKGRCSSASGSASCRCRASCVAGHMVKNDPVPKRAKGHHKGRGRRGCTATAPGMGKNDPVPKRATRWRGRGRSSRRRARAPPW